jgi:hypothetical protein
MSTIAPLHCTAFEGYRRIASGSLSTVAEKTKAVIDRGEKAAILIFDDVTSEPIELDFRGSLEDVLGRLPVPSIKAQAEESPSATEGAARGPGRPRLGVVPREVTLLPRHWEWLNEQPGGASVALRKLVEEARRANEGTDRLRKARESAYRFMSALGGNLPGFEEASRALFAGNQAAFEEHTQAWPKDIRAHLGRLAERVFVTEPVG